MDQLKTQLAVVLKHGFWIGSAIVLIGTGYIWWSTTSKLAAETKSQTSKVENAFRKVTEVRGEVPTTPNDHSHQEMESLINERTGQVLASWKLLYDRQRKILTWPVKALKQDFVDEYIDLIPIERYVMYPTAEQDELESTLLSRYGTYIKNTLPGVASIAKTDWIAEFESSSSMNGMMGMMGQGPRVGAPTIDITGASGGPLVKWSAESQGQVLSDLFPWRGRRPNTLEVYYSQENIWILKQLLQIVADVNGDASQPYQAKIHEIKQFGIGKSVKFGAGQISKPGVAAMGMGMGMDMMGMDGMDMDMDMGMGDMGMDGMGVQVDPADNRYVGVSMEPITGSALRGALESNSPSDASLAVAKRVPVMLAVNIDQRAVHDLIAVCGSSDLMVEVQQVRVLPQGTSASSGMGGGMGMGDMGMESDMDMGGEMGMGMGMGGGMMSRPGSAPKGPQEEFPLDVFVEIYGIIYIYNPPDPVKFGLDEVTADTVIAGATKTIGGTPVAPKTEEGELPVPQVAPPADATPDAPPATAPPATAPPATAPPATTPPATTPPATAPPATAPPATAPPATTPPATTPPAEAPATEPEPAPETAPADATTPAPVAAAAPPG